MNPQLRLIFRGDDMGSARSANRAGLECAVDGMLCNASVMVPGPAFEHAVEMFSSVTSVMGIGLHITLSSEWDYPKTGPILTAAQVPSLVEEEGCFTSAPATLQKRGFSVDEALAEIEAQLGLALDRGLPIEYIDEHMGVSWIDPRLRAGIAALAQRYSIVDARGVPALPAPPTDHADLVEGWIASLEQAAANGGGTFVVVTHPTYDDEEMIAFVREKVPVGETARRRDQDRRALLDPRLRAACERLGVERIRYRDLAPKGEMFPEPDCMMRSETPPCAGTGVAAAASRLVPTLIGLAIITGLCTAGCHPATRSLGKPRPEFARGWEMFRGGEFDVAAEAFQAAAAGALVDDPLRNAALYGEATTWNLRRPGMDRDRAHRLYQQIIEAAPQSELAAWSLLDQATMLYPAPDIEPDWNALAQGYQKVIDKHPLSLAGEDAFIAQQYVVLCHFDPATTREAVARLEKFVETHPESPFAYGALMLASAGYETLGQWRELVGVRQRAVAISDRVAARLAKNASSSLMLNSINWMTNYWAIASVSEFQLGDFATAREYYGRIVERAPADPLYGSALVALKRMDDKESEIRREAAAAR